MTNSRRLNWLLVILVVVALARGVAWWAEAPVVSESIIAEGRATDSLENRATPTTQVAQGQVSASTGHIRPSAETESKSKFVRPIQAQDVADLALLRPRWTDATHNVFGIAPKPPPRQPVRPRPIVKRPFVPPKPVVRQVVAVHKPKPKPKPRPLAMPFTPLGFIEEDGQIKVFVLVKNKVKATKPGDKLAGGWQLKRADQNKATFVHRKSAKPRIFQYAAK